MRPLTLVFLASAATAPAIAAPTIAPRYGQIVPQQMVQFTASGAQVAWEVDNVIGGSTATGTITTAGLYTAPATLPTPAAVTITAAPLTQAGQPDPAKTATATLTLLAHAPAGHTYYVATTGSDANPGTLAAPFATLQYAAGKTAPGDTVLARGGTYRALLTPPHSGDTATGPITFASYPGETATLDGTRQAIPGGQNGLITLNGLSQVIIEGFELQNYTTASRNQVPIGIYVTGAGSGVQIVNNHIHAITTTARTNPNQCGSDALGLAVYGNQAPAALDALVISGNELDHLLTGCSESLTINGNVTNFAVVSNHVHNNDNIGIDAIGFEKVSPDPAYDQARNGEIRANLVESITSYGNPDYGKQYASDGIYVDGGTQITIEQNIVHNTDFGIELASEHSGRLTSDVVARNNLVYANNAAGITIGGYGPARGGTDHCTIVGNTLTRNDTKATGAGELQIQYYATNNIIENNIIDAGPQALLVNDYTHSEPMPATLDYNTYDSPVAATAAHFVWNGTKAHGFAAWQQLSGQDAHSVYGN